MQAVELTAMENPAVAERHVLRRGVY